MQLQRNSVSSMLSDDSGMQMYMQKGESARHLSEADFGRLLVESVDESLDCVLGEIVRKAVYDALEKHHSIARNQIPKRLDDFTLGLENSFGVVPSKTIGKVVIKRLYSKLGLEFVERADWRLPDYVKEARIKNEGKE